MGCSFEMLTHRTFRILSRSTSLRHPDKIFSTLPLPPPPWPTSTSLLPSPAWTTSSSLQWTEAAHGDSTLTTRALRRLQTALRFNHKRKIFWPAEESRSSKYVYLWITAWATKTHYSVLCSLSPSEYLMMLLRPIADICNQLRSPRYLKTPLECIPLDFGQCELTSSHFSLHQYLNAHSIAVYGATFTAEVIKPWTLTSTIILSLVRHIRCSLCYI